MINRTGDGYMLILEKIDGVADGEQEIIILTVSTGSPYKQLYGTAVGTSESPYIRIQRGSLRNSKSAEQNLNGESFYEFTTAAVFQEVNEKNLQGGSGYNFTLNASTKYYAEFFLELNLHLSNGCCTHRSDSIPIRSYNDDCCGG